MYNTLFRVWDTTHYLCIHLEDLKWDIIIYRPQLVDASPILLCWEALARFCFMYNNKKKMASVNIDCEKPNLARLQLSWINGRHETIPIGYCWGSITNIKKVLFYYYVYVLGISIYLVLVYIFGSFESVLF